MFATSQIRRRMEIVGSDGGHVGIVDHMDGDGRISLMRIDAPDRRHHFLATHLVNRVDDKVHLKIPSDLARVEFH